MKMSTIHLLTIVLVIIWILPPLLTLPSVSEYFDFTHTGQIGDTIGGITAPFINGLATILVFLAYKAQVKANGILVSSNDLLTTSNKILQDQEEAKGIGEQIKSISTDTSALIETISVIINRIGEMRSGPSIMMMGRFGQLKLQLWEMTHTLEMIEEYSGNRDRYLKKLSQIYSAIYKVQFKTMFDIIEKNLKKGEMDSKYQERISDLKTMVERLDGSLT